MKEKCALCNKEMVIKVGLRPLCEKHYVETEDKECLRMDLLMIKEADELHFDKYKLILIEIKKKYPDLVQEYKDIFKKFLK